MTHRRAEESGVWTRRTIPSTVGALAVWEGGRGPAVVLRHGIFFDHSMWAVQAESLAHTHRVVLIDAPGHGFSGGPAGAFTLADDAMATIDVLDALGIERATLVGHSCGGMSAVRTALAAPHRVQALALINTPLEPSTPLGRSRYAMLRTLLLAVGAPLWYSARISAAMFSDASLRDNTGLASDLQLRLARAARVPMARAMTAVLVRPDRILDRLDSLAQPVMVLAGDDDYVLPPTTRRALARRLPRASVATMAGKHVLPLERPAETTRRLDAFLAEVEHR